MRGLRHLHRLHFRRGLRTGLRVHRRRGQLPRLRGNECTLLPTSVSHPRLAEIPLGPPLRFPQASSVGPVPPVPNEWLDPDHQIEATKKDEAVWRARRVKLPLAPSPPPMPNTPASNTPRSTPTLSPYRESLAGYLETTANRDEQPQRTALTLNTSCSPAANLLCRPRPNPDRPRFPAMTDVVGSHSDAQLIPRPGAAAPAPANLVDMPAENS